MNVKKILLVAERMNIERRLSLDLTAREDPMRWLEVSARIGCFGTGISRRGGLGEEKLKNIGLFWHDALNLLPPSPICGEWDAAQAREMGMRLARLCRVSHQTNRLHAWDGTEHAPSPFELHGGMTLRRWHEYSLFLLLGRRVEDAFGCDRTDYFHPVLTGRGSAYRITVPHPSGRNRWWNERDNITRARAALEWVSRKYPMAPPTSGESSRGSA